MDLADGHVVALEKLLQRNDIGYYTIFSLNFLRPLHLFYNLIIFCMHSKVVEFARRAPSLD